jgi:hypothetical protein
VPHLKSITLQDSIVSSEWVKPTTLEGDKEYLQFFPQLMEVAKYGETKDHVNKMV